MQCKTCKVSCRPIGATLNGTLLLACTGCGQVYADIPGIAVSRRGAEAAHRAHNPEVGRSNRPAATRQNNKKEIPNGVKTRRLPSKSNKHKGSNSAGAVVQGRLPLGVVGAKRTDTRGSIIRHNPTGKKLHTGGTNRSNQKGRKPAPSKSPGRARAPENKNRGKSPKTAKH